MSELFFSTNSQATWPTTRSLFVQTNNAKEIQDFLRAKFIAIAGAFPTANLIDVTIAGGGAGNVFMAGMYYSEQPPNPADDATIAFLRVDVIEAPDRLSLEQKIAALFATAPPPPVGHTTPPILAYQAFGCAGDGALWIAILVSTFPEEIPPG